MKLNWKNMKIENSLFNSVTNWQKHGIVLEPTEPWEGSFIQNLFCTAEPLDKNSWRIWYSASDHSLPYALAVAEGIPGQRLRRHQVQLSAGSPDESAPYSLGNLPEGWRPVQPVYLRLSDTHHRLYFWAHGPGVVRYLIAESSDGCHYTVLDPLRPCLWHINDRAAIDEAGAQGLTLWKIDKGNRPADEPDADPGLLVNDATNVYRLMDGTFELYTPGLIRIPQSDPRYIAHDNAAGLLRVIDRLESSDGVHWKNRQRVIERDAEDPLDLQFYHLAVTHTPNGRVGMLGHYRVKAQTMDIERCFSDDGVSWRRPERKAWLSLGQTGEVDSYCIYPPHALVRHEKRWWLFYTGFNCGHNMQETHGKKRSVIMLASCAEIEE